MVPLGNNDTFTSCYVFRKLYSTLYTKRIAWWLQVFCLRESLTLSTLCGSAWVQVTGVSAFGAGERGAAAPRGGCKQRKQCSSQRHSSLRSLCRSRTPSVGRASVPVWVVQAVIEELGLGTATAPGRGVSIGASDRGSVSVGSLRHERRRSCFLAPEPHR